MTLSRLSHLSYPDPNAMLVEMLRITRGFGGLRLALADGIDRLEARNGLMRLGFPGLDAYGRERLGRSGRWLGDARVLNRRLGRLDLVREAYVSGRVSTSKAELIARTLVKSGDVDEAAQGRALERASVATVRQLRSELKGGVEGGAIGEEEKRRPNVQLVRHVDRVDAWAFEGVIKVAEALGANSRAQAVEFLLAEGLSTLLARNPDIGPYELESLAPSEWLRTTFEAEAGRRDDAGLVAADCNDETSDDDTTTPPSFPDIGPIPGPPMIPAEIESIHELDAALIMIAAELTRRDLRLGELALLAEAHGLHRRLGYVDVDAFHRECLGVAPASMAARLALARRVRRLPMLEAHIVRGRIGFEAATLIARVASITTEIAWLDVADTLTVKLLREQVEAAELRARVDNRPLTGLMPPTRDELEGVRDFERAVLAMVVVPKAEEAVEAVSPMSGEMGEAGEMSAEPDVGTVPIRLSLPEDIATFWRDLEDLHLDIAFDTDGTDVWPSFMTFLVSTAMANWHDKSPLPAYGDVYLRDRFRCQNPTCRARNVTPHHIIFRSQGGTEDRTNLVSLCDRCHLDLVHGHHLSVSGRSPDALAWRIGSKRSDRGHLATEP